MITISPLAKKWLEKNDVKYTGRQITVDWIYINPFTGYMHFSNVKIYEQNNDSVFISAKGLTIDISILKLLSKNFEISTITLDHAIAKVDKDGKTFNFSDIIRKFTPDKRTKNHSKSHTNILRIKINEGTIYYREKSSPVNYFVKNLNVESPGKRWDSDSMDIKFSFKSGMGEGEIKGEYGINFKSKLFHSAIVAKKFDLTIMQQYIKELMNYGSCRATLDADFSFSGNLNDPMDVIDKGRIVISDFHLGKSSKDDYFSFHKMVLVIKEIRPRKYIYSYDSIIISHPFIKFERYDKLDNFQSIFGKDLSNIMLAKKDTIHFNLFIKLVNQLQLISKNFSKSDYKINHVALEKGDIRFNDYSKTEKFALQLNPISIHSDSIHKNFKNVNATLKSVVKPYGKIAIALSLNPRESNSFDLQYHFLKLPVTLFNPYIISSTSFPMDKGIIELNGNWKVRNGMIHSNNHLVIIDPHVSKKINKKDTKWIPLPLILSFLREPGNVIDYEIPVTGNMMNPKFHIHNAISDLLTNIFEKPATKPYSVKVKNIETVIEKSLTLKWGMRQSALSTDQVKIIDEIADFLRKTPDATIIVSPKYYAIKEQEYILLYEAKKKYFLSQTMIRGTFNKEDSIAVDKMSIRNPLFVSYLNARTKGKLLFTIQEKCADIVHLAFVNSKYEQLDKERVYNFMSIISKKKVNQQVKIAKAENTIPFNGFSYFKIDYKGEFPAPLLKAYQQMNELNSKAPRSDYAKDRAAVKKKP